MPTWNYTSVQFTGPITFHRDAGWLRDIATDLLVSIVTFRFRRDPASWQRTPKGR